MRRGRYLLEFDFDRAYPQAAIFWRDGWGCVYCDLTWGELDDDSGGPIMALDHIVPVVAGGEWKVGNLAAACIACNSRKSGRRLRDETEILADVRRRSVAESMDPLGRVARHRGSLSRHYWQTRHDAVMAQGDAYHAAIGRGLAHEEARLQGFAVLAAARPGPFVVPEIGMRT